MQAYPAVVEATPSGVSISFPDIPEILAFGRTYRGAVACARRDVMTLRGKPFRYLLPVPSRVRAGEHLINLPSIAAKAA